LDVPEAAGNFIQQLQISRSAMVPKEVLALKAIYGQLGQLCIDPEYYNQHAGNTRSLTHALRARPAVEPQSCREMRVKLINHQNIDATDPTRNRRKTIVVMSCRASTMHTGPDGAFTLYLYV
jgi:hypothetical protein